MKLQSPYTSRWVLSLACASSLLLQATAVLAVADEAADSAARASACRVDDTTSVSRTFTTHRPQYFFKPIYGTDWVGYIRGDSPDGDPNNNMILDLRTGQQHEVPGTYDPVPTPDGRYITTPDNRPAGETPDPTGALFFYRREALTGDAVKAAKAKPIKGGSDPELTGVYQSLGMLKDEKEQSTYRVLVDDSTSPQYAADGGGIVIRDFTIKHADGGSVAAQGKVYNICGNLKSAGQGKKHLQLPMISKDGKRVSAVDMDATPPVTKIWNIDDTGSCSGEVSLGVRTGKVDFNYGNSNQVTFAMVNNETLGGGYFTVPSDNMVSNVYVLDLSSGKMKRLTSNTDSNSVYPSFRKDGTIVYLDHPKGAAYGDKGPHSSFVVANPGLAAQEKWQGDWRLATGQCPAAAAALRFRAQVALGALWSRICSAFGANVGAGQAALATLSLDPARCQEMVTRFWDELKQKVAASPALVGSKQVTSAQVSELAPGDLKAACPKESGVPVAATLVGEPGVVARKANLPPWPRTTPDACASCHADIFNNPARLKTRKIGNPPRPWAEVALELIENNKMPKGILSEAETGDWNEKKKDFISDLKKIKDGVDP